MGAYEIGNHGCPESVWFLLKRGDRSVDDPFHVRYQRERRWGADQQAQREVGRVRYGAAFGIFRHAGLPHRRPSGPTVAGTQPGGWNLLPSGQRGISRYRPFAARVSGWRERVAVVQA